MTFPGFMCAIGTLILIQLGIVLFWYCLGKLVEGLCKLWNYLFSHDSWRS